MIEKDGSPLGTGDESGDDFLLRAASEVLSIFQEDFSKISMRKGGEAFERELIQGAVAEEREAGFTKLRIFFTDKATKGALTSGEGSGLI